MVWIELLKETFFRKRFIFIGHSALLFFYMALFFLPFPLDFPWGGMILVASGILLPLLLTSGIFGNDIATGRIDFLVTKPISLSKIFLCRISGVILQGTLHIMFAGFLIWMMHSFFNDKGTLFNFKIFLFVSWLLFITFATLSISLSVLVEREYNTAILILGSGFLLFLVLGLKNFFPEYILTKVLCTTVKYVFPPVELLSKMATGHNGMLHLMGYIIHAAGLAILYSTFGILMLRTKEFKRALD